MARQRFYIVLDVPPHDDGTPRCSSGVATWIEAAMERDRPNVDAIVYDEPEHLFADWEEGAGPFSKEEEV